MDLPKQFADRMKERLGDAFPAFLRAYDAPAVRGLRANALKISPEEFARRAPFPLGERVAGTDGFYLSEEKTGGDVYHFAGLYYLQEPSAMMIGRTSSDCPKERVLDLCAAPGGKTTLFAAQMKGEGILVANEIDSSRAKILSQNVERTGIRNCAVTSAPPERIAERFPEYFDLVSVDAPCSGEGMFKKEPNAIPEWSAENVLRCAARQKRILDEAAKTVARGGRLLYSTCTFAEEEDEWQIADFLARHAEFSLIAQEKYYPHEVRGEGHFVALLGKTEGGKGSVAPFPVRRDRAAERAFRAFAEDFFREIPEGEIATLPDGRLYLVPAGAPEIGVRTLRLGVELGEWDGKRFKPAHALAMALGSGARRRLSLSRAEAERYLRGEQLEASIEKGWCVVCVEEFPIGLGKAADGVVKNHLPKGLRMLR